MSDIFDEVHSLEASHIEKGRTDGLKDGIAAGFREGRSLGYQKGYEIGVELGFYDGCVKSWRVLQGRSPPVLPAKADKNIDALEELLAEFPLLNPQDERLQDLLETIRGKFKAIASLLGQVSQYLPKETQSSLTY